MEARSSSRSPWHLRQSHTLQGPRRALERARSSDLSKIAVLFGLYVVTARLGLLLEPVGGFATRVWAPSGLSIAALLIYGYRPWPFVFLGAFLVNAWAGGHLPSAAGIAAGNTLEALVATYLIRRVDFHRSLDWVRDVIALTVLGGCVSTIVSATVGVTSLRLGGLLSFAELGGTWLAWWWGDLAGVVVVAPLLLTWNAAAAVDVIGRRPRHIERIALAVSLIVVGTLMLYGWFPDGWFPPWLSKLRMPYSLVPLLIWAGIRFGPRGAARTNFLISCIALSATVIGLGPFVRPVLNESLLALQSFITTSAFATLILGAIAVERGKVAAMQRNAERELLRSHEELEQKVLERTADLGQVNLDLTRREEQLRQAQALAHLGSFEWDIEADRVVWSDELYRIYGIDLGAPISHAGFLERVHPDDRARVRAVIDGAFSRREAFTFEERIVRPDGAVRILQSQAKVERDSSGAAVRMLGTCQDVTEQRQAEQAHYRLAAIVESSGDAIIGRTLDGLIESWNGGAEKIYGYSAEEAVGAHAGVLVPAELHEELERLLDRVRAGERVGSFETKRRRKDGTIFDASVTVSPILDMAGRCIGISEITRDITGYKKAEGDKEVLLREIHHRVKNNLQVIASLLNLQASVVASVEAQHGFEESQSRIQSMALVHQLLYQSKDLASIDFEEYLRDLVSRLANSYGVAHGRILFEVKAPDVRLDIDTSVPCGLIVNELVSNSLKHAFPEGKRGHVWICLELEGDGLFVLTVRDDGIGIPERVQLETVRTLGLQIVRTLTRQLHGVVEVVSDHGTTFRIKFRPPAHPKPGAL